MIRSPFRDSPEYCGDISAANDERRGFRKLQMFAGLFRVAIAEATT
jgi:hypothetical protein